MNAVDVIETVLKELQYELLARNHWGDLSRRRKDHYVIYDDGEGICFYVNRGIGLAGRPTHTEDRSYNIFISGSHVEIYDFGFDQKANGDWSLDQWKSGDIIIDLADPDSLDVLRKTLAFL